MKHLRFIGCLLTFLALRTAGLAQGGPAPATILDHKDRIRITRLDILNSSMRETNLSVTPDGNMLYFMSLRGGQRWSQSYMRYQGDSVYDGDIWYSRKVEGRWTKPQCMPYGINTALGEDEPSVAADGKTVYFQSWNELWTLTGGPYYKATREGTTWGRPVGLSGGITEFFRTMPATDGMCVSADQKKFLVAAGMDYDANMDIYMSKANAYGWGYCQKLGISTPGDERSVFLAADGRTLYFASDGYKGFGGLDIYKTVLNSDGTFGEIINVGAPFNTPGDDYGLILTATGNEAYFVRNGDIYFADLTEADTRIKPVSVVVTHTLAGTVRDSITWKGLTAEVLLLDAVTKTVLQKTTTNATGKYSFSLPNKTAVYDEVVVSEGYIKVRRRITVEQKPSSQTLAANFLLAQPPKPVTPPVAVTTPPPVPPPVAPPVIVEAPPVTVPPVTKPADPAPKPEPVVVKPAPQPAPPANPYSFEQIARNNLVLLLDVSASMNKPEKLPLLKNSLRKLLSHMRAEDMISVIVYSGEAQVVLDGVSAARGDEILKTIDKLNSGGATDGKEALRRAYKLATENYISGGNNRIILATDGYFDVESLYSIPGKHTALDIPLTVFSFGKLPSAKEDALERLADLGGGNYANITTENADKALLDEAKAVRTR